MWHPKYCSSMINEFWNLKEHLNKANLTTVCMSTIWSCLLERIMDLQPFTHFIQSGSFKLLTKRMWHQLFLAYFEDCEPLWLSYYFRFSIWLQWVQSLFFLVVEVITGLLQRKRKRRISDAVNVCSLDISLPPEQENKRKRGLSKVVSLANLLSTPMRPVRKIGASFQVCHDV